LLKNLATMEVRSPYERLFGGATIPTLTKLSTTPLYKPLDHSIDSIRLLKIEAGSEKDQIRCQLIHVAFASKPKYEALSYTWGRSPLDYLCTIMIDSHAVKVRENLYLALFNIREENEDKLVWADAVCINQDDLDERNRQVSLMAFIYSRAQAVLVWLGKEPDDRDHITIPSMHSQWIYTWLSTTKYWSRVWIVQEIGLAKKIYCFWKQCTGGRVKEEWRVFVDKLEVHASATARLPLKLDEQRCRRFGNMNQLEHLLANFADAQCEEPRDKIYGFLGLAHGYQEGRLEVDYSKSLFDLYVDLMTFHHLAKPLDDPLPPQIDRAMRLAGFSRLVQRLFDGGIENDIKDRATRYTPEHLRTSTKMARGLIEGVIIHLGPSYSSVISSFAATRKWRASLEKHYHSSHELSLLRELDDAYTTALLEMEERDLARVCEITSPFIEGTDTNAFATNTNWTDGDEIYERDSGSFDHWKNSRMSEHEIQADESERTATGVDNAAVPTEPRRFLASNLTMGLVPPEARKGDLICRFWDCDVAAVLRLDPSKAGFQIIGRADVATGWSITQKQPIAIRRQRSFEAGGGVVMVVLDIPTLQKLTR
jgi:Heterokaryon incompatibility protein (HET)